MTMRQVYSDGSASAASEVAADEGEVYRIVSGCLSVGCTRKQKTKLAGNGEDKDSVAETAINY